MRISRKSWTPHLRFAGLWNNFYRETEPCEAGIGIDPGGVVHWTADADARFIYVLAEGSENVGEPPGLERSIIWRMDTDREEMPHPTGTVTYGVSPAGAYTRVPADGDAPALEVGTTYKLIVLRDFGPSHLTNCSFVFGDPLPSEGNKPFDCTRQLRLGRRSVRTSKWAEAC